MRIDDKIDEIEKYISELGNIVPESIQEYKKDIIKAACERYFEKVVEALVDLAFLIIKDKKYKIPEEDKEAFDILAEEKIISNELAKRLKEAKGMRNILAHEYGKTDDELVFKAIKDELESDVKEFIRCIK